jgi:DNA-binding MarR family transcriptional regulator
MPNKLSEEDREVLHRLLQVVEIVREMKANMSVTMLSSLLRTALNEGKSVAELTKDAGVAQSVMSRHILDLGPMTRDREVGLQLVEHRLSPTNLRIHEIVLTRKGLSLMGRIADTLKGSQRRR